MMDFYMLALDASEPGVYNVGTDRYGTLREALEQLIAYAGTTSRVRSLPVGLTIAAPARRSTCCKSLAARTRGTT
jgi:hypothetical protein